jgi:hypothetical protein
MARDDARIYTCVKFFRDRSGGLSRDTRDPAFAPMTDKGLVRYPFGFVAGLLAAVALVVAGAGIYGGGTWAVGAFAGGGAVAADFVLIATVAVILARAAAQHKKRLLLKGILALAAKALLPFSLIAALFWITPLSAQAVALGAVVVATFSPLLIALHFLREIYAAGNT